MPTKIFSNVILLVLVAGLNVPLKADDTFNPLYNYVSEAELSELTKSQKKGLEIAVQQDLADQGWKDSKSNMQMILRNKDGRENFRDLEVKALEVEGDGDKNLTLFNTPKDVKGTAFLTFSHILRDDEQWLYLPALKRVKRINSRNKSGPFMGSEFAFEDLVSFEVAKFEFNYLKDDVVNGVDCYVVERTPKDENSGYTKVISWVDKEHKRFIRSEFYDRKKALLKSLEPSDYELYLNKFWRAKKLLMTNHQTEKSTELILSDIQLSSGLDDRDFSKGSLKRAR